MPEAVTNAHEKSGSASSSAVDAPLASASRSALDVRFATRRSCFNRRLPAKLKFSPAAPSAAAPPLATGLQISCADVSPGVPNTGICLIVAAVLLFVCHCWVFVARVVRSDIAAEVRWWYVSTVRRPFGFHAIGDQRLVPCSLAVQQWVGLEEALGRLHRGSI